MAWHSSQGWSVGRHCRWTGDFKGPHHWRTFFRERPLYHHAEMLSVSGW